MRLPPLVGLQRPPPKPPAGEGWVIPIGVNRPAFGRTVPHFHHTSREIRQMSRILLLSEEAT